ncbi:prostaglandin reductase-3-like isoform X3 [Salvia splendens]|uniref:prostaglandin reductase-3-like isoform X3 n=1 Tax=Salvia splendens TaxID=180675 RepID=UPI001C271679|nr:prostaglandin reductase-3-like isoform X3 [Salvia splendens]
MELKPGLSAIVTGGAAGIGRALVLALAQKGIFITIIDFSQDKGIQAASLAEEELRKFHTDLKFPPVLFFRCDVSNSNELAAAFRNHVDTYGGLDICINCAGIATPISFYEDQTDGFKSWRRAVDINFVAVIESTRLAIRSMKEVKKPGVIINVGSASGLYPMYADPIYSGSKGGVVLFTRSLALYKRQGIRVNVLCPEFVQTELASKVDPKFIDMVGGFMSMEVVVKGAFDLISDESKAGACLWISNKRGLEYWPTPAEEEKYRVRPKASRKKSADVLQVNFSSGRYFSGSSKDTASLLPFDAGFEAVGIIAAIGDSVKHLKVGTPAAIMTYGSYAEFTAVPSKHILPVARPDPEVVAMLTSGLTASIALEKAAQMDSGKTVLITAAAGGTGQFAVQLAKLAGNKVIATCGGKDKARLLKDLGVDRIIDYKAENIKTVLKDEFPKGVDIIYESVGGEMFDLCLNALTTYGRLIVIGMISQYQGEDGWKPRNYTGLCEKILAKSQTVAGFFLVQYAHFWQEHLDKLMDLYTSRKLKVIVDPKTFVGVHSVADAVNYLHSGKSVGKVVVCMDPTFNNHLAKL